MDQERLRLIIRRKIQDGRLPLSVTKVQGSPSAGEKCDVCEATLSQERLLLEVMTLNRQPELMSAVIRFGTRRGRSLPSWDR